MNAGSPAGAFCYCFPQVIEGIHPHRQGEAEILGSIRSGAAILGLLGVLYTYVGWSNMQVELEGKFCIPLAPV